MTPLVRGEVVPMSVVLFVCFTSVQHSFAALSKTNSEMASCSWDPFASRNLPTASIFSPMRTFLADDTDTWPASSAKLWGDGRGGGGVCDGRTHSDSSTEALFPFVCVCNVSRGILPIISFESWHVRKYTPQPLVPCRVHSSSFFGHHWFSHTCIECSCPSWPRIWTSFFFFFFYHNNYCPALSKRPVVPGVLLVILVAFTSLSILVAQLNPYWHNGYTAADIHCPF